MFPRFQTFLKTLSPKEQTMKEVLTERLRINGVVNFTAEELLWANRWGREQTEEDGLNFEHVVALVDVAKIAQTIRNETGPLRVISGYRCPAYNRLVGGATGSRHMSGMAMDLRPTRISVDELVAAIERLARQHGWKIGVGVYPTFVHIDCGNRSRFTRFS
jgi:uncharacterized protein YcbK (DUF882 family)